MSKGFFEIIKSDTNSQARLGVLSLASGEVQTPAFIPWGTKTELKAAVGSELGFWGAEMITVDSFQLFLHPGDMMIAKAGGLRAFLGWKKPILTSAGRFTLSGHKPAPKFFEAGIYFKERSSEPFRIFTPEQSVQAQINLGADIISSLHCPVSDPKDKLIVRQAAEFSALWAARALRQLEKSSLAKNFKPKVFAAVPGGNFFDIIKNCAEELAGMGFDGFSFPGAGISTENSEALSDFLSVTANRPRHLRNLTDPMAVIAAIAAGADAFDSSAPVKYAQAGKLFVNIRPEGYGVLDVRKSRYGEDSGPPDNTCGCYLCLHSSRAELYKMFKENNPPAERLSLIHNLRFYFNLMEKIRRAIKYESFDNLVSSFRLRPP